MNKFGAYSEKLYTMKGREAVRAVCCVCALACLMVVSVAWGDCDDHTENAFYDANCSFEADTSGWTFVLGSESWVSGDGSPEAGSMELTSEENLAGTDVVQGTGPCRAFTGDQLSTLTNHFRLMSGSNVSCQAGVEVFTSSDCSSGGGSGWVPSLSPSSSWEISTDSTIPDIAFSKTIQSARYEILCISSSGPFTVRYDHAWLAPGDMVPVELTEFSAE